MYKSQYVYNNTIYKEGNTVDQWLSPLNFSSSFRCSHVSWSELLCCALGQETFLSQRLSHSASLTLPLTVSLSTKVLRKLTNLTLGVTYDGPAPHPGGSRNTHSRLIRLGFKQDELWWYGSPGSTHSVGNSLEILLLSNFFGNSGLA